MTQVSRHPVSKAIYERIFKIFLKSVVKIGNEKEAEEFFSDFLTPTERIMLAKRLSIALLLSKDYDYQTIRRILRVSQGTIAGVNVFLKFAGKGYRKIIEKIMKEETLKDSLLEISGGVASLGSIGGKGSESWRKIRNSIQRKQREKPF